MDSMEVNKGLAGILLAGIVFFLAGWFATTIIHPHKPEHAVLKIEGGDDHAPAAAEAKAEALAPISPLLAKADAAAGEATAKKLCASCHTFNEGGKAGVGPNIYGAVGGDRAASAGFAYSNGLKGKAGKWGYEDLNEWLAKPSAFAPGTRMSFAGIKAADQRANVIAYLRTLSKSPVPLP